MTIWILVWLYLVGLYTTSLLMEEAGFRTTLSVCIVVVSWPLALSVFAVLVFARDFWEGLQRGLMK